MAYTPKTWTTGETITAAELNAIEQAASAASSAADTANSGLSGKVNSGTYTAGLAGKADLASGTVPDAQLPTRLSDASLKAAFDAGNKQRHSALRPARAALAARSLNVLHIGDSVTDGYAATALGKRWVDRFAQVMRTRLGLPAGGLGFLTPGHGWPGSGWPVTTNSNAIINTEYGPCGRAAQLNDSSATATLTLPAGHTGVDVSVVGYPGAGNIAYAIDGGSVNSVSTSTGSVAGGQIPVQIRGLSPAAPHTILFTSSYSVPIFIEGFMCYAGDEAVGVRPITAGIAGASSAAWLYAHNGHQLDAVSTLLPQLVTIELGINDYTGNGDANAAISPAQFTTNLQALIAQVRSHYTGPGPSFVLMGMWPPGLGGESLPHAWDEYLQAQQTVADSDTAGLVALLNVRERVNPSTDPALGTQFGVVSSDQIHPTDVGHAVVADALADFLLAR